MKNSYFIIFIFIVKASIAQVGIGTDNPLDGSILDITSSEKGVLVPRVNIQDLSTIAPITGGSTVSLLVWNINVVTGVGFHYWSGSNWTALSGTGGASVNAVNGLVTSPTDIRLGGDLIQGTTITHEDFNLIHNLNGLGDFHIADNGANMFSVLDNGRITVGSVSNAGQFNVTGDSYFSDDISLRDGAVDAGDVLVRIYDSADDGVIDIYENNTYNIRLHGNGPSVFNEQGITTNDFRIESDTQANQLFIDAGSDEIGIRNGNPTSMLHMTNGGQNVGVNAMANFENTGPEGVALQVFNLNSLNSFNAIEGITSYNGTAFSPAGVFGLGIDLSLTHGAVGVRGTVNGRDGTGVYGTRQNGAGAGWGGLFLADLGYTGFFGNVSDRRLKKNILPIDNALDIVLKLNPVTYNFDLEKYPYMGLNTEKEYGFIAQEVREILPEITREKNLPLNGTKEVKPNQPIKNESESFLILDYTRIIPILTKAIKEQQTTINKQNERLDAQEKKINLLLSKT
jgi:hypothetical protein